MQFDFDRNIITSKILSISDKYAFTSEDMANVVLETEVLLIGTKRNPIDNSSVPCNFTKGLNNDELSINTLKSRIE